MLPFVTSQAIALSQIKAKEGELTEAPQDQIGDAVPHRRKSFLKRMIAGLVELRMHKAGLELEAHHRTGRDSPNT